MTRSQAFIYLGGSAPHRQAVQKIRRAGFLTVVADLNAVAPAVAEADEHWHVSVTDSTALCERARALSLRADICGCYAVAGYASGALAKLYEEMAQRGGRLKPVHAALANAIRISADKGQTKNYLARAAVRVPRKVWHGSIAPDLAHLERLVRPGLPVVVKPTDANNSRGVQEVRNGAEAIAVALREALKEGSAAVVEELVDGRLYNVDGLMIEGEFFPVAIIERTNYPRPSLQPFSGIQPAALNSPAEKGFYEVARGAAEALGYRNGPFTVDTILGPQGPAVLEFTPNFHVIRTHLADTNEWALDAWLAYLSGDKGWRCHLGTPSRRPVGYFQLTAPAPGILRAVDGLEELARRVQVMDVYHTRRPGDLLRSTAQFADVCLVIFFAPTSVAAITEACALALQTVRVTVDPPSQAAVV